MLRKVLMLAITTGLASKLYRNYRQKHAAMAHTTTGRAPGGDASKTMNPPQTGSSAAGVEV